MSIYLKDNQNSLVSIEQWVNNCHNNMCKHKQHCHNINHKHLYSLTNNCFEQLKSKLMSPTQMTGGGQYQPQQQLSQIQSNLRNYALMHNITNLTHHTEVPYFIITSALQIIPDDEPLLLQLYPQVKDHCRIHNQQYPPTPNQLLPIGLFLNQDDLDELNKSN